jgi:NADH-quinone oxidoreductase subunit H
MPFDIPTAEQELVIGWQTEYSGAPFVLCMFANYISFGVHSLLLTIIFLGGWLGPSFLPPIAWLLLKTFFVATLTMMLRGTYPRVRLDQLLRLGWRILIPLALINILMALLLPMIGIV